MKKLILLVEDNPQHRADAIEFLEGKGYAVEGVACFGDAWHTLRVRTGLAGVITDLYLPYATREARFNHADSPCGLNVVIQAQKAGKPVVVCTSGYHHGSKYQFADRLCQDLGIPFVDGICEDGCDQDADHYPKDWAKALQELERLLG